MNDYKSIFASKTVWAAIVGVIVAVLVALGKLPENFDSNVIIGTVFGLISALTAVFRIQATTKLVVST